MYWSISEWLVANVALAGEDRVDHDAIISRRLRIDTAETYCEGGH